MVRKTSKTSTTTTSSGEFVWDQEAFEKTLEQHYHQTSKDLVRCGKHRLEETGNDVFLNAEQIAQVENRCGVSFLRASALVIALSKNESVRSRIRSLWEARSRFVPGMIHFYHHRFYDTTTFYMFAVEQLRTVVIDQNLGTLRVVNERSSFLDAATLPALAQAWRNEQLVKKAEEAKAKAKREQRLKKRLEKLEMMLQKGEKA